MCYRADKISRVEIRQYALLLRKKLGLENKLYFPIILFLENVMPAIFPQFEMSIIPKDKMPPHKHAATDIVNRIIYIREDIYEGAVKGKGRDRMTIAHELGHYLLSNVYGIGLYRDFCRVEIQMCENPEWQAKAFAGELLCPYHLIGGLAISEITKKCGVSKDAARTHFNIKNYEA